MNLKKRVRILFLALSLVLPLGLLAACEEGGGTSPSPSGTETSSVPHTFEPRALPSVTTVPVEIPGFSENGGEASPSTETHTGALQVSENHGYAVFVLEGFTFASGDTLDTITWDADPEIKMTIQPVPSDQELSIAPSFEKGIWTQVDHRWFDDNSKWFEIIRIYPESEEDGAGARMNGMMASIRTATD